MCTGTEITLHCGLCLKCIRCIYYSLKQITFVFGKCVHNAVNQEQNHEQIHKDECAFSFFIDGLYYLVLRTFVSDIEFNVKWLLLQSMLFVFSHRGVKSLFSLKACYIIPVIVRPLSSNIMYFSISVNAVKCALNPPGKVQRYASVPCASLGRINLTNRLKNRQFLCLLMSLFVLLQGQIMKI